MKLALKIVGVLLLVVVLAVVGLYAWASFTTGRLLSRTIAVHTVDFPIPFPLSAEEVQELKLTEAAAESLAWEHARERGRHLVESRYVCTACHGEDLSGGTMVDTPAIGRLLGPNLTAGQGSRTAGFGPADWDRIVRHGVRRDARPAVMPSEDFEGMSDQELSDVVVFVQSHPPVDREVPPISLGPLGKVLAATGQLVLSADVIGHDVTHASMPPAAEVSVEFGRHLAGVCIGCHRQDLAGGPIVGGDPSWAPARNITPHASGLGPWTYEQFVTAMREGKRPDGATLLAPMAEVLPYTQKMTDVELQALWAFLKSVPAAPSREK